jgi:putative oxygen-independent coproporphyrinogen III oxidase
MPRPSFTDPVTENLPGLYIHIPFCQSKCPYCDFYSVTNPGLVPAYLTALEAEARLYREQFPAFDTLFLGGGTPSWLDPKPLAQVLQTVRRYFVLAPNAEITLEANPDDISPEKLRLWKDLGINRLSLGVQSFDEAELRFLGRRHTAAQTRAALELIRAAGFSNLGLDLIYGLPGQTMAAWRRTLKTALRHNPEHLSCYQLTLAPDTPMGRKAAAGRITLPDEETQRQFFLTTSQFLTAQGYLHYEVANFARQGSQAGGLGHYCCRHNLKYWRHVPYLGLGPGAHSFQGRRRWWNLSSVEQYGAAWHAGRPPLAGQETLTSEQIRLETLFLGFRTREGVSQAALRAHPGWEDILRELIKAGLVRVEGQRVAATARGLVVADRLPLYFTTEARLSEEAG